MQIPINICLIWLAQFSGRRASTRRARGMPPKGSKRQPALSEAHAKATGLSFINSFFKAVDPPRSDHTQIPLKKRGRPPKVARSGRPQQAQSPTAASATTPAAGEPRSASTPAVPESADAIPAATTGTRVKEKRVDWSTTEHQEKLRDAVQTAELGQQVRRIPHLGSEDVHRCVCPLRRHPEGNFLCVCSTKPLEANCIRQPCGEARAA